MINENDFTTDRRLKIGWTRSVLSGDFGHNGIADDIASTDSMLNLGSVEKMRQKTWDKE